MELLYPLMHLVGLCCKYPLLVREPKFYVSHAATVFNAHGWMWYGSPQFLSSKLYREFILSTNDKGKWICLWWTSPLLDKFRKIGYQLYPWVILLVQLFILLQRSAILQISCEEPEMQVLKGIPVGQFNFCKH